MLIFGASGDLTRHKLLPAIFNLCEDGHLPEEFAILGIARPPMQETDYRAQMREQVREVEGEPLEDDKWQNIERRLYYISGEFDDATLQVGTVRLPGARMICLFNWDAAPRTLTVPLPGASTVADYWSDQSLGRRETAMAMDIAARSARLLKVVS